MKQAQVEVGGVYDTRVSGAWVKVRVVSQMEFLRSGHVMGKPVRLSVRFRVERLDNKKVLPNARPASALHVDGRAVTRAFHLGSHQSSDGSVIEGPASTSCGCQSCRSAVRAISPEASP